MLSVKTRSVWETGYKVVVEGVTDLVEQTDNEGIPLVGGDDHGTSRRKALGHGGSPGRTRSRRVHTYRTLASTKTRVWTAFRTKNMGCAGTSWDTITGRRARMIALDQKWSGRAITRRICKSPATQCHNVAPGSNKPPVGWATVIYTLFRNR